MRHDTDERKQEVLEALTLEPRISRVAKRVKVNTTTIAVWRRDDPEFEARFKAARRQGLHKAEDAMMTLGIDGKDYRALAFILSRALPDEWGLKAIGHDPNDDTDRSWGRLQQNLTDRGDDDGD